MEIILMEDVPSVGKMGDRVRVSDGYARNYLLPRKKAVIATAAGLQALEHARHLSEHKQEKSEQEAQELAQKLAEISCTVVKPAGEGGKLFGAVTSADIEGALRAQGVAVDRKKIALEEPIKNIGAYTVSLKLHPTVVAQLNLVVEKE
ncbi:MAG: 50S ribosomal protein L9 [Deltaproteobacteria bacterium RBG_16_54_11]|jgi:large subunit ribosomal protein L9|nr:MAG: 50S ribosomal protein L9 [Deltaproteobacteria bacterium RBG_16_54_11]